MKRNLLIPLITALLILLWAYASLSKLLDYNHSRAQMLNQVFPAAMAGVLVWAVPLVELLAAALLAFDKTRLKGLYLSAGLLAAFSGYIALILLHVFSRVPCSCGGIISKLGWGQHLVFNLFFLALTLVAIIFYKLKAERKLRVAGCELQGNHSLHLIPGTSNLTAKTKGGSNQKIKA